MTAMKIISVASLKTFWEKHPDADPESRSAKVREDVIRTKQDYQEALKAIASLFDNQPEIGTPEFDHMEVMVLLIEAYEAERYPIDPPDPIEAIKFRMEQSGLTVKDLEPAIGKTNRVYEILNGKR